jgi:hypothetical protein
VAGAVCCKLSLLGLPDFHVFILKSAALEAPFRIFDLFFSGFYFSQFCRVVAGFELPFRIFDMFFFGFYFSQLRSAVAGFELPFRNFGRFFVLSL